MCLCICFYTFPGGGDTERIRKSFQYHSGCVLHTEYSKLMLWVDVDKIVKVYVVRVSMRVVRV